MSVRIGDRGHAACPLYPSGRVLIGNAPIAARSVAGPIEAGAEIVVVGGDRFSLHVRQYEPSQVLTSLARFGEPILTAKEEAATSAAIIREARQRSQDEYREDFRRLLILSTVLGVVIGFVLVGFEVARFGYSDKLLWVPFVAAVSWFLLAFLAFFLGSATENLIVFISIPCALAALIAGMVWRGPFVSLGIGFVVGVVVALAAFLLEAVRHPLSDGGPVE
jgi:hypothetical protein